MQILRNSEDYASGKLQGFSYHGYSNRLVFNILIGAECFSGLGDNNAFHAMASARHSEPPTQMLATVLIWTRFSQSHCLNLQLARYPGRSLRRGRRYR